MAPAFSFVIDFRLLEFHSGSSHLAVEFVVLGPDLVVVGGGLLVERMQFHRVFSYRVLGWAAASFCTAWINASPALRGLAIGFVGSMA